MKVCTTCGLPKPIEQFYLSSTHPDGRQSRCSRCQNRRRHGDNFRGHIGMTRAEFVLRWRKQKGMCLSCDDDLTPSGAHIDHDHSCCSGSSSCKKCRRGLLCRACNVSLGIMHEDPERIRKLSKYAARVRA